MLPPKYTSGPVYECASCERDICAGDIAYKIMGEVFCLECVTDSLEIVD